MQTSYKIKCDHSHINQIKCDQCRCTKKREIDLKASPRNYTLILKVYWEFVAEELGSVSFSGN